MTDLVVDIFSGFGGASEGIEQAGLTVDMAFNHSAPALAAYALNHPETEVHCENLRRVRPLDYTRGRPVGVLWMSPDCTEHSAAKGGKPIRDPDLAKRKRTLPWTAIRWIDQTRPVVIFLENVWEMTRWPPLVQLPNGTWEPDWSREGQEFRRFNAEVRKRGYHIEYRRIAFCDYGDPTSRSRLMWIARRDGRPIIWPEPTHGPGRALPWRTAADDVIDWSIPCRSIFNRPRPLADATMARIGAGVWRYVINAEEPFIVPFAHQPANDNRHLVAAFLAQNNTGEPGHPAKRPVSTIVGRGSTQSLVTSHLIKLRGTCKDGQPILEPLPTLMAAGTHVGQVQAFLIKYYGTGRSVDPRRPMPTATGLPRFGLVYVYGEPYQIVDIAMRMLTVRELARGQGLPDDYELFPEVWREVRGKQVFGPITNRMATEMIGNGVPPKGCAAHVRANCDFMFEEARAVAA